MSGTTSRRKVVGATLIGIALVLGSFILSDFGAGTPTPAPLDATATLTAKPAREYIPVTDTNNDGVEDWREVFVTDAEDLIVTNTTENTPTAFQADTLTDQLAVQLMSEIMRAKARGIPFDQERFLTETTARASMVATDKLYTERDIIVSTDDSESITNYGNGVAKASLAAGAETDINKIDIVYRAVQTGNPDLLTELDSSVETLQKLRDAFLNTPVPPVYKDEHLAMINSAHALHTSYVQMQAVFTDPIVALMRVNRFADDLLGLENSIRAFHNETLRQSEHFASDDPVWVIALPE